MILRRIRGVFTLAALGGLAMACAIVVFTSVFFLTSPTHGSARDLLGMLTELLPMPLGLGGLAGALFGLFVILGERGETLDRVSEGRFRVWGGIAGAISFAALQAYTHFGGTHRILMLDWDSIFSGGFAGAMIAPALLRLARRANGSPAEPAEIPPTV
jgi:hypothetical protein